MADGVSKQSCVTARGPSSAVNSVWSFMRSCVASHSHGDCGIRTQPSLSYDDSYGSFIVELEKGDDVPNWGLILAGGSDRGTPVVVASLRKHSIADDSDTLQPGDFIIAVNGSLTDMLRHSDLVDMLVSSRRKLCVEVGYDMQPLLSINVRDGRRLTYAKAMRIKLTRGRVSGLGFILRGGLQEHTGRYFPLTVMYIRPGGPASEEGSMRVGDRLVAVNGVSLFQASLTDALRVLSVGDESLFDHSMNDTRFVRSFTLTIEYDVIAVEEKSKAKGPITVVVPFSSDGSPLGVRLGLSIWDGASIVVEEVRPGSTVDRCGALHPGDRILMINGVAVEDIPVSEVNEILDRRVLVPWRLLILPSHLVAGCASLSGWSEKITVDTSKEQTARLRPRRDSSIRSKFSPKLPRSNSLTRHYSSVREPSSKVPPSPTGSFRKRADSDPGACRRLRSETHIVELWPDYRRTVDRGYCYGFSLTGKTFGADGLLESPPVISAVDPSGSAKRTGLIQEGDRILSVNGSAFASFSLETLCATIAQMKPPLSLMLAFDIADNPSPRNGTFLVSLTLNGHPPGITFSRGGVDRSSGLRIDAIAIGSPAHRCGCLAPGDVITAIGDHDVNGFWKDDEVMATMESCNDPVQFRISRDQNQTENGTVLDRVDGFLYRSGSFLASNGSLDRSVFDSWTSIYDPMALKSPRGKPPSPCFSFSSAKRSMESLGPTSRQTNNAPATNNSAKSDHQDAHVFLKQEEDAPRVPSKRNVCDSPSVPFGQPPSSQTKAEAGDDPWEELLRSLRVAGSSPGGSTESLATQGNGASTQVPKSPGQAVESFDFFAPETFQPIYDVPNVRPSQPLHYASSKVLKKPSLVHSGENPSSASEVDKDMDVVRVTLQKDPFYDDFGFSVSDGLSDKGVYVNRIRPNGPADLTRKMRAYDRIVEVNGADAREFDCCLMVPFVASAGDSLELVLTRPTKPLHLQLNNLNYGPGAFRNFPLASSHACEDFVLSPASESI